MKKTELEPLPELLCSALKQQGGTLGRLTVHIADQVPPHCNHPDHDDKDQCCLIQIVSELIASILHEGLSSESIEPIKAFRDSMGFALAHTHTGCPCCCLIYECAAETVAREEGLN